MMTVYKRQVFRNQTFCVLVAVVFHLVVSYFVFVAICKILFLAKPKK